MDDASRWTYRRILRGGFADMTVATHVVTADFSGFGSGSRLSANVTISDNVHGVAVSDGSVGYVHGVIQASVDNNVLLDAAGATGVELTSNDPALNIDGALQYTFSFNDVKIDGVYVPNAIPDIVYNAPDDDAAVDLIEVAPAAWVTVVGLGFSADALVALLGDGGSSIREALDGLYGHGGTQDEYEPYANQAAFPVTGAADRIYLDESNGKLFWWNGSGYLQIGNKAAFGLSNVDNTTDLNKPVSTAQAAADAATLTSANAHADAGVPLYPVGSTKATRVQQVQTVDIRDYITSGTTFDLAAVVAAMEAGNGTCYIPPGYWQPNAFNVALDNANVSTAFNAAKNKELFTYKFFGAGKQSRIVLPAGMSSGDFLMVANLANASGFNFHPKVLCENFSVTGSVAGFTSSASGSFMKSNQRSISAQGITFTSLVDGFYCTGYSDLGHMSRIHGDQTVTGWLFNGINNGDGLVFDQIFGFGCGAVNLTNCQGASIRSCNGGALSFTNSVVSLGANHLESYQPPGATTPVITIKASTVHIESGVHYVLASRPFIQIDDTGTNNAATNLIIEPGVVWSQRLDTPGSTVGAVLGSAIDILNLGQRGQVRVRGAKTFLWGGIAGGPGGELAGVLATHVTASGDSTLNTLLSSAQTMAALGGDFTIRFLNGAWTARPSAAIPLQSVATPTVAAAAASSVYFGSDASNGTYYYKVSVVDPSGMHGQASAEASATVASNVISLTINAQLAPATLRILRGTATGVYDHWVQIPIAASTMVLTDQGSCIAGYAWQTIGIPTPPASSELVDGTFYPFASKSTFWGTAAPTVGPHNMGDVCFNSAPSSGGPTGWLCSASGTPGTWIEAGVSPVDTLALEELTNGESTFPRALVSSNLVSGSNGTLRLSYFTAKKTETITKVRTIVGSTAAAGATLCRVGIYSIDGSGNLTLVASIANDTGLWIVAGTAYTSNLSASFSKVRRTRYAIGHLVVGSTTAPNFNGMSSLNSTEPGFSPIVSGVVTGQTDLPSTVAVGSIAGSAHRAYVALVP